MKPVHSKARQSRKETSFLRCIYLLFIRIVAWYGSKHWINNPLFSSNSWVGVCLSSYRSASMIDDIYTKKQENQTKNKNSINSDKIISFFEVFFMFLLFCFFMLVNSLRSLRLREWLKIQLLCLLLEITLIWSTTKIGIFLASQGKMKNTIRVFSNAIRMSAGSLIVSADRIRKKTCFQEMSTTNFVKNQHFSLF